MQLKEKIYQWHSTWVEACQDRLFQRDYRWTAATPNLKVGDIIWLIQDSKLSQKLKWGLVRQVCPDEEGVVRDVIVRYAHLQPGPQPYITPYKKKGPFKEKLVAVKNTAPLYTKLEQMED